MKTLTLSIVVLALLTPALASAGSPFVYSGSITPSYVGYAGATSHRFTVDVAAGQTIAANVVWTDPLADVDVTIIAPGGTCRIYPDPEPVCIAELTLSRAACIDGSAPPFTPFSGSHGTTLVAPVTGQYIVAVNVQLAAPSIPVAYTLTASVDSGGAGLFTGPTLTNVVQTGVGCRFA